MKRMTKIVIAAGLILGLFTISCNKNHRPETSPVSISGGVILGLE